MPKRRIDHLVAVGLALAVVLGLATATGASGASDALQGKARIQCEGAVRGPDFSRYGQGRFTLTAKIFTRSGGITTGSRTIVDRGRFSDQDYTGFHRTYPHTRILVGAKGRMGIAFDDLGHWRILRGTMAYAGLRGRGTERGL